MASRRIKLCQSRGEKIRASTEHKNAFHVWVVYGLIEQKYVKTGLNLFIVMRIM